MPKVAIVLSSELGGRWDATYHLGAMHERLGSFRTAQQRMRYAHTAINNAIDGSIEESNRLATRHRAGACVRLPEDVACWLPAGEGI